MAAVQDVIERVKAALGHVEVQRLPPAWHAEIYGGLQQDGEPAGTAGDHSDKRAPGHVRGLAELAAGLHDLLAIEHLALGGTPRSLMPEDRLRRVMAVEQALWAALAGLSIHPTTLVAFLYREVVHPAAATAGRDAAGAYLALLLLDGTRWRA